MTGEHDSKGVRSDEQISYEVGYGRPPLASRFKKGRSGNPKGRPKSQSKAIGQLLLTALDTPVTVSLGGREQSVDATKALLINLVHQAIKGDPNAFRALRKPLEKSGVLQRVDDPTHPTGVVCMTKEEMHELRKHPERLVDIVRRAREREATREPPRATARMTASSAQTVAE
jgi:hypothetical protein